jgi:putative transposase
VSDQRIDNLQEKAIPVSQAWRILDVSRAGFYATAKRGRTVPGVCSDRVHLRAVLQARGRSYGSRRLYTAPAYARCDTCHPTLPSVNRQLNPKRLAKSY